MQKALDDYVEDHYRDGIGAVYEAEDGLVAVICNIKLNGPNFWNGNWRSSWKVKPGDPQIKGKAKAQVHYFEEGNIQMHNTRDFTGTIVGPMPPVITYVR